MTRTHTIRLLAIAAIPVVSILLNGRDSDPLSRFFRRPELQARPLGTSGRVAPQEGTDGVDAELRQDRRPAPD